MPITLQTNARNAAVDGVTALMDGGGTLNFVDTAGATVATVNLSSDAFAAAVTGVATANGLPLICDPCAGSPTAANVSTFNIKTSGGTTILTGDVTNLAGSGSFRLSDLLINAGDRLVINTFTYTQPAS